MGGCVVPRWIRAARLGEYCRCTTDARVGACEPRVAVLECDCEQLDDLEVVRLLISGDCPHPRISPDHSEQARRHTHCERISALPLPATQAYPMSVLPSIMWRLSTYYEEVPDCP